MKSDQHVFEQDKTIFNLEQHPQNLGVYSATAGATCCSSMQLHALGDASQTGVDEWHLKRVALRPRSVQWPGCLAVSSYQCHRRLARSMELPQHDVQPSKLLMREDSKVLCCKEKKEDQLPRKDEKAGSLNLAY